MSCLVHQSTSLSLHISSVPDARTQWDTATLPHRPFSQARLRSSTLHESICLQPVFFADRLAAAVHTGCSRDEPARRLPFCSLACGQA